MPGSGSDGDSYRTFMIPRLALLLLTAALTACTASRFSDQAELQVYVDEMVDEHGDDPILAYDAILASHVWSTEDRRDLIRHLIDDHAWIDERGPAKPGLENENVLIGPEQGLQSRDLGRFRRVAEGTRGDRDNKYLWTLDHRGINIALENTPFPTPRGVIVHSNLSAEAYIAGEAWFRGDRVIINAGSGRFGDRSGVPSRAFQGAIRYWQHLGYEVEAIPFGKR